MVGALALAACSSGVAVVGTGGSGGGTSTSTGASTSSSTSASTSSSGGPVCADPPNPEVFEVGTGETCFERLTPGQTVPVMQGPQGGFHVWLAVGCADCATPEILRYSVRDPTTQAVLAGTQEGEAVITLDADGWHQGAGYTDFLPGVTWQQGSALPKGTHVLIAAALLDKTTMAVQHQGAVEVVLGDTMPWSPPCDPSSTCGTPGGLPCCSDLFDAGTF